MLLLGSHGPLAAGCIHQSSFSRHLSPGQQVLHVSQILCAALSQIFDSILFPLELHKAFYAFKAFIPTPPKSPIPPFLLYFFV